LDHDQHSDFEWSTGRGGEGDAEFGDREREECRTVRVIALDGVQDYIDWTLDSINYIIGKGWSSIAVAKPANEARPKGLTI